MSTLLVTRSVLASFARLPAWWLGALALVLSWPALRTFLPLGLATADLHHWTAAYEVAFVGGLLAILGAIGPIGRMDWILRPAGPVRRTAIAALALVAVAVVTGGLALLPAHAFHSWQLATFRTEESLAALVLGWAHVALVAAAALQVPLDPVPRAVLVGLAVGVLPGLVPGDTRVEETLLVALDAGGTLRTTFDFPLTRAHWIAAFLPILGWGAVAVALASPPDPPPSDTHALRDPR